MKTIKTIMVADKTIQLRTELQSVVGGQYIGPIGDE